MYLNRLYTHNIAVLDTDTLKLEFIENPYALNFYKFKIDNHNDLTKLNSIKSDSIISVVCNELFVDECKEYLNSSKIITYKLMISKEIKDAACTNISELSLDHISKFIEFCNERISRDSILEEELEILAKN